MSDFKNAVFTLLLFTEPHNDLNI